MWWVGAALFVASVGSWVGLLVWEFWPCGGLNEEQVEAYTALAVINARVILRDVAGKDA